MSPPSKRRTSAYVRVVVLGVLRRTVCWAENSALPQCMCMCVRVGMCVCGRVGDSLHSSSHVVVEVEELEVVSSTSTPPYTNKGLAFGAKHPVCLRPRPSS